MDIRCPVRIRYLVDKKILQISNAFSYIQDNVATQGLTIDNSYTLTKEQILDHFDSIKKSIRRAKRDSDYRNMQFYATNEYSYLENLFKAVKVYRNNEFAKSIQNT